MSDTAGAYTPETEYQPTISWSPPTALWNRVRMITDSLGNNPGARELHAQRARGSGPRTTMHTRCVQVPQSSPAMSTRCWQLCICLSIGGASQTVSGSFWCVAGLRLDGKSYFPKCLTEAFCMSDLGRSDTSESCLNRSESI